MRRIGTMMVIAEAGFLSEFDPALHKYEVMKYGVFIAKHPRLIRRLIHTYDTTDPNHCIIRREAGQAFANMAHKPRVFAKAHLVNVDEWRIFETYDEALVELDRWRNNEAML